MHVILTVCNKFRSCQLILCEQTILILDLYIVLFLYWGDIQTQKQIQIQKEAYVLVYIDSSFNPSSAIVRFLSSLRWEVHRSLKSQTQYMLYFKDKRQRTSWAPSPVIDKLCKTREYLNYGCLNVQFFERVSSNFPLIYMEKCMLMFKVAFSLLLCKHYWRFPIH